MKYILYILAGISFGVGFVGVFLPLIPTVPLFLLGIYLLSRVSKKNIVRIKKVPLVGKTVYRVIKDYRKRKKSYAV